MEEIYIGTKIVAAEPTFEFRFKGSFEAIGREGYKVRYEDGYVSWSPKETFERAYRKVTNQEAMMIMGACNQQPL